MIPRATIVGSLNQSWSRPMSSMIWKQPIQSTSRASPTTSIGTLAVLVSAGRSSRKAAMVQPIATGMLIRKIQCQLKLSLM
jgi:hypothetical protein